MMGDSGNAAFGHWGQTSEEILQKNFPLHRACRDGDPEVLSMLLVEAQHSIYIEDSFYGWTPAHWSAYFGKLNCLMRLMESGMNCDTASMRLNQTPAHIAAFACNSHCLKWLLHCGASKDRQLACLRKLMTVTRIGADCSIRTSRFKQTPSHLASFGDHPQCLQWLLMSGAEVDAQDYLGETPVHKAARTGSMECVSLLASHGARLFIRNNSGLTPAQLAANCGFMDCSKFLESAASRQEQSENLGVYEEQSPHQNAATPSPHDITANGIDPCVIKMGINAGKLPPLPTSVLHNAQSLGITNGHNVEAVNGFHGECEMEEENLVTENRLVNGHSRYQNGDITLSRAVSSNQVPIAGRKRCREDADENEFKRMRKNEIDILQSASILQVQSQPHTQQSCFEQNLNSIDAAIDMDGDYEPYQEILSLSTEPLRLNKPVVPSPLQGNCGCPYIFM